MTDFNQATPADPIPAVSQSAGANLPWTIPGAAPQSHLLECIRLQNAAARLRSTWRNALPGDTPLGYVERSMRVDWRIRDVVPGYSHRASRTRILALAPVRRLLRDERRRALEAADNFMLELAS